jgi:hypothetical protein
MKSSYELAMERLGAGKPSRPLTAAQKAEIADLESLYKSRIAQREISFQGELSGAQASGDPSVVDTVRAQFLHDKRKLEEELEAKKERVRNG